MQHQDTTSKDGILLKPSTEYIRSNDGGIGAEKAV